MDSSILVTFSTSLWRKLWHWNTSTSFQLSQNFWCLLAHTVHQILLCCALAVVQLLLGRSCTERGRNFLHSNACQILVLSKIHKTIIILVNEHCLNPPKIATTITSTSRIHLPFTHNPSLLCTIYISFAELLVRRQSPTDFSQWVMGSDQPWRWGSGATAYTCAFHFGYAVQAAVKMKRWFWYFLSCNSSSPFTTARPVGKWSSGVFNASSSTQHPKRLITQGLWYQLTDVNFLLINLIP